MKKKQAKKSLEFSSSVSLGGSKPKDGNVGIGLSENVNNILDNERKEEMERKVRGKSRARKEENAVEEGVIDFGNFAHVYNLWKQETGTEIFEIDKEEKEVEEIEEKAVEEEEKKDEKDAEKEEEGGGNFQNLKRRRRRGSSKTMEEVGNINVNY